MLHRTLFVLIDGIGDVTMRSHATPEQPHGRTPMQVANLPNMDLLARHSLCGLLDSVEGGQACGSDTAHLSLLGYDPLLYYRGRGAFESMGSGLDMRVGDVAFKSNFARIDPASGVVTRRRADRAFHDWGLPLCAALDGAKLPSFPDVTVSVRHATEHRVGVRISGPGLSDCVSGTDPLVDGRMLRRCEATTSTPEARRTAAVVNELSDVFRQILSQHPLNLSRAAARLPIANVVLLRGAGARIAAQPFCERHALPGRALMLAPTAIIAGLGRSLGFDVLPSPPDATGDYRSNLRSKARTLLEAMRDPASDASFGFLHVKAVDDAGHDRDAARKIDWLERSHSMLAFLLSELFDSTRVGGVHDTIWTLVVTGDHSTPLRYGDHSVEPVPMMVCNLHHLPAFANVRPTAAVAAAIDSHSAHALRELATDANPVRAFDELQCARGVLGRFPGRELMPLLLRLRAQLLEGASAAASPAHQTELAHSVAIASSQPASHPQLQSHLTSSPSSASLSSSSSSSSAAASSSASAPRLLPFHPDCRLKLSPWLEDCAAELASFSPASHTPLPAHSSVVVIGAGLSGLSAALHLCMSGLRPLVLERGSIGSGATGHNGGHMHPVNESEVWNVERMMQVLREQGGVSDEDVELHLGGGWSLLREAEGASEHSSSLSSSPPLSTAHIEQSVHSSLFPRSTSRTHAGSMHPVKLLAAFAHILRDRYDTPVWQHTPVEAVEPCLDEADAWIVRTTRGSVRARCVLHATNAWAGDLLPALRSHVTPVRNHVIHTTPVAAHLPDDDVSPAVAGGAMNASLAPSAVSSSSSSSSAAASSQALWRGLSLGFDDGFGYMIQRASGGVVFGGLRYTLPRMDVWDETSGSSSAASAAQDAELSEPLLARLRSTLPAMFPLVFSHARNSSVSVRHAWSGVLGFTSSGSPIVGGVPGHAAGARGQFVLAGFSGHGMPRCHAAGERVAGMIARYIASGEFEAIDLPSTAVPLPTQPDSTLLARL